VSTSPARVSMPLALRVFVGTGLLFVWLVALVLGTFCVAITLKEAPEGGKRRHGCLAWVRLRERGIQPEGPPGFLSQAPDARDREALWAEARWNCERCWIDWLLTDVMLEGGSALGLFLCLGLPVGSWLLEQEWVRRLRGSPGLGGPRPG